MIKPVSYKVKGLNYVRIDDCKFWPGISGGLSNRSDIATSPGHPSILNVLSWVSENRRALLTQKYSASYKNKIVLYFKALRRWICCQCHGSMTKCMSYYTAVF